MSDYKTMHCNNWVELANFIKKNEPCSYVFPKELSEITFPCMIHFNNKDYVIEELIPKYIPPNTTLKKVEKGKSRCEDCSFFNDTFCRCGLNYNGAKKCEDGYCFV